MTESAPQNEQTMWQLLELSKAQLPELAQAYYGTVSTAVYSDGALDLKTKRLMSLAIAVQAGCHDCMISQTSRLLELGATPSEILETCAVAISMGGTLAWSKALVVIDYLQSRGLLAESSD